MSNLIEDDACFVIHAHEYKEHSLLLSLFSLNLGRVSAIARSARKSKSTFKSFLQPFMPLKVTLTKGKGELYALNDCTLSGRAFNLPTPEIFCAMYANELLYYLYKVQDSEPKLFAAYLTLLKALNDKQEIFVSLRRFELTLLNTLGCGISFQSLGQNILDSKFYIYDVEQGFVEAPKVENLPTMLSGRELNQIAQGDYSLKSLQFLTSFILENLLEGKEIKSRKLYEDYLKRLK